MTNKQKWSLPTRNVLRDGVDDSRKSLDIPAQEACSNVPISKSMCSFPVPMITNCQNIIINYTIFPRKWLSFMSLHTFLLYCHSRWIYCLLLKFGSYIICIRPQKSSGRIMSYYSEHCTDITNREKETMTRGQFHQVIYKTKMQCKTYNCSLKLNCTPLTHKQRIIPAIYV